MLGVVNRYWKHIVRSADDYFNKWLFTLQLLILLEIQINSSTFAILQVAMTIVIFQNLIAFVQRFENQMDHTRWLVTYDELPRDEEKFPGKSPEYYPDYIGGQSV